MLFRPIIHNYSVENNHISSMDSHSVNFSGSLALHALRTSMLCRFPLFSGPKVPKSLNFVHTWTGGLT